MSVSILTVKDILVCLVVFIGSLLVGQFYTESDQLHYIEVYRAISDYDLIDGFNIYKSYITTEEPGHYLLIWIFSSLIGINKLSSMAFCNSILSLLFIKVIRKFGGSSFVSYPLVLSNFYLFVLYFAAERLKFSFIFLLCTMLYADRARISIVFFLLSVLSHLQMLIFLAAREFERRTPIIISYILHFKLTKSSITYVFSLLFTLFAFVYIFGDYLFWKIPQYAREISFSSIWQTSIFMLLSLIYHRNKQQVYLFFIPIIIASLIVGPERIVILSYFTFIYFSVKYKRGLNAGIGLTHFYFGFKSLDFLFNVLNTGQGFSG